MSSSSLDTDDFEFPEVQFHYAASTHSSGSTKYPNEEPLQSIVKVQSKKKGTVTVEKLAMKENQRNIQPDTCQKFMEVIMDEGIQEFAFFPKFISAVRDNDFRCKMEPQLVPNSISWKRNMPESYVDENGQLSKKLNIREENHVVLIWSWEDAVKRVADKSFCDTLANTKTLLLQKTITLVIYGIEEYFKYNENLRKRALKDTVAGTDTCSNKRGKLQKKFADLPRISRDDLASCLAEAQIISNCNNRMMESPLDLAVMIIQYTKAIAETMYKLQKRENMAYEVNWNGDEDNRDCRDTVKVDKDGNGLKRLWVQQLCQFPLCTLEIAESISSLYPCPILLMEAYENCTPAVGEMLLKDVPIRRAAGSLTARKIGPEMSKKIYVMFTSQNGNTFLEDQKTF